MLVLGNISDRVTLRNRGNAKKLCTVNQNI